MFAVVMMQHVYILSLWYTLQLQSLSLQQHLLCLNTRGQQQARHSHWGGLLNIESSLPQSYVQNKLIANLLSAAFSTVQTDYGACSHIMKGVLIYTVRASICECHSLASPLSADSLSAFTGMKTKNCENNAGGSSSPTCIAQYNIISRVSQSMNMTRQALLLGMQCRNNLNTTVKIPWNTCKCFLFTLLKKAICITCRDENVSDRSTAGFILLKATQTI